MATRIYFQIHILSGNIHRKAEVGWMNEFLSYFLWHIYRLNLYTVIICILLVILGWAIIGLMLHQNVWKFMNKIGVIFVVCMILYATVFSRTTGNREIILVPFQSFKDAILQPEMYRTMLMNVLLFVPFGLCFPFSLPEKAGKKVLKTVFCAMLLSIGIEIIQYCFALGRAEVDDVIMNTVGAFSGGMAYVIYQSGFGARRNEDEL